MRIDDCSHGIRDIGPTQQLQATPVLRIDRLAESGDDVVACNISRWRVLRMQCGIRSAMRHLHGDLQARVPIGDIERHDAGRHENNFRLGAKTLSL